MKKCILIIVSITLVATGIFTTVFWVNAETHNRELYLSDDYVYEILPDNTITIHYYIGSASQVTVPSYIDNVPVESIEAFAFYDTTVKDVNISEGITTLKNEAFFYCKMLESVTLPSTLEKVGYGVFRDCVQLKTVTFSKGTSSLGNYMFYGCTGLEEVNLPDSITDIPAGMFSYCQNLRQIDLPECINTIYDYAFYGCGLEYIELPAEITVIQQKAFANNRSLATIFCDDASSVYVSEDAFENCIAVFPDHGAPGGPTEPQDPPTAATEPAAPSETETPCNPDASDTEVTEVSLPTESYESKDFITDEGFYIGEADGFLLYESSKISSAKDTVKSNRDELLSLAWNVRTLGDVNNDNKVNIKDATQVQRFVASIIDENSPGFNYKNADVDTDGKITVRDATAIQKFVAKVIVSFT
ncbi:MAG: leucine-rich repeat protein [Ruminococcus sp.]